MTRSSCLCGLCRVGCYTMPGSLVPGDLEKIAAHKGFEPGTHEFTEFVDTHFMASEGALVGRRTPNGVQTFRVPSITPAQKQNRECVFLDERGLCSIHEVSPYGCAHFDAHMSDAEAHPLSEECVIRQSEAQTTSHPAAELYKETHARLSQANRTADSLAVRRQRYKSAEALAARESILPNPKRPRVILREDRRVYMIEQSGLGWLATFRDGNRITTKRYEVDRGIELNILTDAKDFLEATDD